MEGNRNQNIVQRITNELRQNGHNSSANAPERFLSGVNIFKDFPKDY